MHTMCLVDLPAFPSFFSSSMCISFIWDTLILVTNESNDRTLSSLRSIVCCVQNGVNVHPPRLW